MRIVLPTALAFFSLFSSPLLAQEDLSVDELMRLFERQKEVFSEANSSELGETRGLKLVTVDNAAASRTSGSVTAQTEPAPTDPNKPIAPTPVLFGQLDPELQVNLRITFGFDSAALAEEEKPKIEKMCQVLQQSDINLVRIVGHTDTSGSAEYNDRLSALRAQEVARYLTESCGISSDRLETLGMGERFPANTSDSRADENRRVEFQALS